MNLRLCRLDNGPGADAAGTGHDPDGLPAFGYGPNLLDIGHPAAAGFVMGMADIITGYRAFATDFTFTSHCLFSLSSRRLSESAVGQVAVIGRKAVDIKSWQMAFQHEIYINGYEVKIFNITESTKIGKQFSQQIHVKPEK